jgi:hypothetical protein
MSPHLTSSRVPYLLVTDSRDVQVWGDLEGVTPIPNFIKISLELKLQTADRRTRSVLCAVRFMHVVQRKHNEHISSSEETLFPESSKELALSLL